MKNLPEIGNHEGVKFSIQKDPLQIKVEDYIWDLEKVGKLFSRVLMSIGLLDNFLMYEEDDLLSNARENILKDFFFAQNIGSISCYIKAWKLKPIMLTTRDFKPICIIKSDPVISFEHRMLPHEEAIHKYRTLFMQHAHKEEGVDLIEHDLNSRGGNITEYCYLDEYFPFWFSLKFDSSHKKSQQQMVESEIFQSKLKSPKELALIWKKHRNNLRNGKPLSDQRFTHGMWKDKKFSKIINYNWWNFYEDVFDEQDINKVIDSRIFFGSIFSKLDG